MANLRGWKALLLALVLPWWLGCEEVPMPVAAPSAAEPRPTAPLVPVQERHCELILLNPSPTPDTPVTAPSASAPSELPPPASTAADLSEEPPAVKEFRRLHREIPPAVVQALRDSHFQNYSVHIAQIRDDYYAVRYYEYVGHDFAVDMASLEHTPAYRQWRDQWEACQVTLLPLNDNQWWAPLKEIGHID